jgi:hypothetical protein
MNILCVIQRKERGEAHAARAPFIVECTSVSHLRSVILILTSYSNGDIFAWLLVLGAMYTPWPYKSQFVEIRKRGCPTINGSEPEKIVVLLMRFEHKI